jgi:hypothetical protein
LFVVLFPFAIELLLEEKKRQSAAQAVCHADPNHPFFVTKMFGSRIFWRLVGQK